MVSNMGFLVMFRSRARVYGYPPYREAKLKGLARQIDKELSDLLPQHGCDDMNCIGAYWADGMALGGVEVLPSWHS